MEIDPRLTDPESVSSLSIGNTDIYILIFVISIAAFICSVQQFRRRTKKSAGSLEGLNV